MSIPQPQPHEAQYYEIYYKDVHVGQRTLTVWAWYNFREGYGIIKRFDSNHKVGWGTIRADTVNRWSPSIESLVHVDANNEDVHGIIDWAIRIVSNAGKTWGVEEGEE